ncbi:Methylesterase 1 [Bienertia sinuspersici]
MEDKCFSKKHFVLVHGGCHGAWCWFKLKPLMESIGYRVTVLDMAASGINLTKINEIRTAAEYSEPLIQLMASLPDDEKVVIVGHSLGGLNIALAMEMFPHKIAVAVFLTAFMPDSRNTPSFVFDQFAANVPPGGQRQSYQRYGSVYVVTDKDEAIPPSFQWWMIENDGVKDVRMLRGSDHMSMLCIPKQLSSCLHEIAQKYC